MGIGIAGAVFGALLLFEAFTRFAMPAQPAWADAQIFLATASTSSALGDYHPYIGMIEEPFSGAYPFSAVGNEPRASKQKPADLFRIIVLGSSVAQSPALERTASGFALSEKFSPPGAWWRGCAARMTQEAARPIEVLSAGIQSVVTTNEVAKLLTADLLDWSPDMILMLDGFNDAYTSVVEGRAPGIDLAVPYTRFRMEHPLATGLYRAFSWSKGATALFQVYAERSMRADLPYPPADAVAERMVKNYSFARAVARGAGAKFAVLTQPAAALHAPPHNRAATIPEEAQASVAEKVAPALTTIEAALRVWSEREGVPYHSYLRLFDGKPPPIFYDWVHFSGAGYRVLCDALARDLAPAISAK